jgi:hypothetical protein
VSVILPTFNRAAYLAEAIDSVLVQTPAPREVIVVDDGSTDATPDVVARYGDRLTSVRQPNAGKLTAIATGLDRASGDLVWIMDDDDIATPDALALLSAPFARDPATVLSYGRMTRFTDGDPASEVLADYPDDDRPFFVQLMERCFIAGHPCVLTRRDALQSLRPFDPAVIASVDYYLHLGVAMQGPAAAVDGLVLRQRQHPGLRGPAGRQYSEAQRVAKWIAHDAYLFTRLLADLPLQAYLDPPPWTSRLLGPTELRHAHLQMAVIAGRKKLWPQALAAFDKGMAIQPDTPLDPATLTVLTGMFGSRYGFAEVFAAPDIVDALHRATRDRSDRAAILTALARPLLLEIKAGRNIRQVLRLWRRMMDSEATVVALRSSVTRNTKRLVGHLRSRRT